MKWILLVVFYGTGFTQEFDTKQACERASAFAQANALAGVGKATCLPKGDK